MPKKPTTFEQSATQGEKLIQLRGERTQEEVAEGAGIGARSLARYEANEEPTPRIQKLLASYFKINRKEIF